MSLARLTEIADQGQEAFTGYTATITSDHAYIHKGIAFTAIIDTGTISAAYRIAFKTPTVASGKYIHWRPIGITTSANYIDIEMTEADTFTGGTTATPIDRNRVYANTSNMQSFKKGVTSTPAGVLIYAVGAGTDGRPRNIAGGGSGADEELLLKQNTDYVITITPADETKCVGSFFWYEEPGGTEKATAE